MKEKFFIERLDKYGEITYRVVENRKSSVEGNPTWKLTLKSFKKKESAEGFKQIIEQKEGRYVS